MEKEATVCRHSRWRILPPSVLIIMSTIYLPMGGRTQTINALIESCDKNPVRTLSKNDGNPYNNQYVYACLKVEDIYSDKSTEKVSRRSCRYESTTYYNQQSRRWESVITYYNGCTESKTTMPSPNIDPPKGWHPPIELNYK
jgi:hypothetical protein